MYPERTAGYLTKKSLMDLKMAFMFFKVVSLLMAGSGVSISERIEQGDKM